jgi:hypothetical protein
MVKGLPSFFSMKTQKHLERDVQILKKDNVGFLVASSTNISSSHEWKNE